MHISSNIQHMRPSATIAVSTLAKRLRSEGRDIIDLSAGQPDFDTPGWVCDAGVDAIRGGMTRYTPTPGVPELRKAIAAYLSADIGRDLPWEGIVVSSGAKQSLFNACFSFVGPGDEVLIGSPYWTSYPEIVGLARALPVAVAGPEANSFKLDPKALDAAATDATRALLLSTPSNPSGAVYTRSELAAVVAWARERDIWLLSDEIYQRIYFGSAERAPGLLDFSESELGPHIVFNGVSKSFAMTGWRIGYSCSTPEVAKPMADLQSHVTSNPASPSQYASIAALADPDRANSAISEMRRAFERRRDLVVARFQERLPQLGFVKPEGAFYLYFRIDPAFAGEESDSVSLCSWVLQQTGVAIVPGAAFGDDRFARMSFASSDEELEDGIGRLATALGPRL